jgi:hypothetical protein
LVCGGADDSPTAAARGRAPANNISEAAAVDSADTSHRDGDGRDDDKIDVGDKDDENKDDDNA